MRVATTRIVAASPPTIEANTKLMADMLERLGPEKPDFVLLSENLNTRGVKGPLAEKAQTIPGPLTEMLAAKARRFRTHVITTLLERDGNRFYNTAVLLDRDGRLAGKYRKVHLTIGEMESGLTPGSEYPVVRDGPRPDRHRDVLGQLVLGADADPSAAAARRWSHADRRRRQPGALGCGLECARARQRRLSRHVVDRGGQPERIIDPAGTVVAESLEKFGHAIANLDLNREWRLRYLSVGSGMGEARSLYLRERRPDTYAPMTRDEEVRPPATPGS